MSLRGATYRQELQGLTDEQWEHAVRECLRGEEWFPVIATLLRYASEYEPPTLRLPPADRRTPEEIERGREAARKGMEMIRAEMAKRGLLGEPAKEMP